jgi:hypothetical protein
MADIRHHGKELYLLNFRMRKSAQHILVLIFAILMFVGCSKGNLDKELNYNPFDPEYVGESPFQFISAIPFTVVEAGLPVQKIRVRFSVNETLFTSEQAFYSVRISYDESWADFVSKSSFTSENGIFEYEYTHPPESDCIYLALENGLSISRQFSLCFEL